MVDITTLHPFDFDRNLFNFLVIACLRIIYTTLSRAYTSVLKRFQAKVAAWLAHSLLCERDPSGDYTVFRK